MPDEYGLKGTERQMSAQFRSKMRESHGIGLQQGTYQEPAFRNDKMAQYNTMYGVFFSDPAA